MLAVCLLDVLFGVYYSIEKMYVGNTTNGAEDLEDDFGSLSACPLFEGMQEEELRQMLSCLGARVKRMEKDQVLFEEGGPARFVGIVLSGRVRVLREDYDGNRSILASIEPGQLFGEAFACAGVRALPVSVAAVSEGAVLLLDCRRVLTTCSGACRFHTRLIQNLLRVVAEKNLLLNQKIEFVSKRTTREKLLAYLRAQAKKSGSREFTIPYDRQGLADYLGVERSAMSAEIGKLRREGVLETRRSWFKLL